MLFLESTLMNAQEQGVTVEPNARLLLIEKEKSGLMRRNN